MQFRPIWLRRPVLRFQMSWCRAEVRIEPTHRQTEKPSLTLQCCDATNTKLSRPLASPQKGPPYISKTTHLTFMYCIVLLIPSFSGENNCNIRNNRIKIYKLLLCIFIVFIVELYVFVAITEC